MGIFQEEHEHRNILGCETLDNYADGGNYSLKSASRDFSGIFIPHPGFFFILCLTKLCEHAHSILFKFKNKSHIFAAVSGVKMYRKLRLLKFCSNKQSSH